MKLTVKSVSPTAICSLAEEYCRSFCSLNSLSAKYGCTPATLSNILWKGIAENIVSDATAKSIYNKIVAKSSIGWYQRKLRWDKAFVAREALLKKKQLSSSNSEEMEKLISLKEYYESAISSYDAYFFDEESAPSIEYLKEKLEDVNRKIATLS